jgi:hypothetical protein
MPPGISIVRFSAQAVLSSWRRSVMWGEMVQGRARDRASSPNTAVIVAVRSTRKPPDEEGVLAIEEGHDRFRRWLGLSASSRAIGPLRPALRGLRSTCLARRGT